MCGPRYVVFNKAYIMCIMELAHIHENYAVIGRAGASPPSRTTGPRCLYVFMYLCIYLVSVYRVPDTVNF